LKKRSKKLLSIWLIYSNSIRRMGRVQSSKSFLVLFFKKELLSFFSAVAGKKVRCKGNAPYGVTLWGRFLGR
jgi:hypothetical protein